MMKRAFYIVLSGVSKFSLYTWYKSSFFSIFPLRNIIKAFMSHSIFNMIEPQLPFERLFFLLCMPLSFGSDCLFPIIAHTLLCHVVIFHKMEIKMLPTQRKRDVEGKIIHTRNNVNKRKNRWLIKIMQKKTCVCALVNQLNMMLFY